MSTVAGLSLPPIGGHLRYAASVFRFQRAWVATGLAKSLKECNRSARWTDARVGGLPSLSQLGERLSDNRRARRRRSAGPRSQGGTRFRGPATLALARHRANVIPAERPPRRDGGHPAEKSPKTRSSACRSRPRRPSEWPPNEKFGARTTYREASRARGDTDGLDAAAREEWLRDMSRTRSEIVSVCRSPSSADRGEAMRRAFRRLLLLLDTVL